MKINVNIYNKIAVAYSFGNGLSLRLLFIIFLLITSCLKINAQIINVSTASQLQTALNNALPGQIINIADGFYLRSGGFYAVAGIHGTAANPITVTGSKNAILSTGTINSGYGFSLKGNNHWVVKGFTTYNCKNGVVIDSSKNVIVDDIYAYHMGQTGINLRTYTSYSIVQNCFVDTLGLIYDGIGEGIYVGTANSNWPDVTNGNPDTCNYNQILNNSFGNAVTSENIDIKEGTKYGLVRGNTLNGTGLSNTNGGDSWIDVKGNYWTIELNTGTKTTIDGFQTHVVYPGWGSYNTFRQNTIVMDGGTGHGVYIQTSGSNGTASGNIVCNNNTITGGTKGLTNVATQACGAALPLGLISFNANSRGGNIYFLWVMNSADNISHFDIESSSDGINFTTLKRILSYSARQFSALVPEPVVKTFYRLKVVAKNNDVQYSSIKIINGINKGFIFNKDDHAITVTNPNNTLAYIQFYAIDGRLLQQSILKPGANKFNIYLLPRPFICTVISNNKTPQNKKIYF